MHIARNSLDHGIENTATRNDRGKSEKGTIHLSACQTGGRVTIKITDDGGGINREKIIKKAMEADLLSKTADPKSLTDRQVFNFLFAPGFSTAEKVTDVSGRGVGMDVVKTNIEKIKGIIDIETLEGLGTSLTISIPLTTAITEGMTFRIGSEFYIFPMDCIRQLIQVEMSDLIKIPSGQKIIKHRNKIYPFFRLEELFESKITSSDSMPKSLRLALIDTSKQVVAIKIDQVLGLVKAVLKPLTDDYKKSDGLSGAAVLASGQMSLVVDPIGLERIFAIQGIKNGNNG
jgi:two-component system chemotaxis sensor kinase CheA